MRARMLGLPIVLGALVLGGCGGPKGYEKAFSTQSALVGNSQEFKATADQTFRTVKVTLVQQGFTIEQIDVATGLIKAVRSLQDPKKSDYAYLITATVDVTGQPSGKSTTVTVAASQQTVLHKDSEKYFHLLGLVPIPSGREHQTVVTKEGNIDKAGFYNDFFATVHKNLTLAALAAAAPSEAVVAPLPAPGVTTTRTFAAESLSQPVVSSTAESAAPLVAVPVVATVSAPAASLPPPAPSPKATTDPDTLAPLDP
jgi:hypothetical protein